MDERKESKREAFGRAYGLGMLGIRAVPDAPPPLPLTAADRKRRTIWRVIQVTVFLAVVIAYAVDDIASDGEGISPGAALIAGGVVVLFVTLGAYWVELAIGRSRRRFSTGDAVEGPPSAAAIEEQRPDRIAGR